MGDVYRATDTVLGRTVAVKVLSERYAGDEDVKRRFKNEGLAAARLSGAPSTVTIFDVGEDGGQPYLVMEYFDGGSLEQRLKQGPVEPADALRWLEQAAAALDAGHAAGVVHRDVKPGNLLLDSRGEVHVADFGVASTAGLDSLTKTGMVLGTAGYLAPEQAQGQRATPATDRYALGVVAWELLTGRRPFESDSPTAEAMSHVNAPVPRLSAELDPVFQRALAKDPSERYPTAAAFVADLRRAFEPEPTAQTVAVQPAGPRRGMLIPVLLAGGLLLLGGGIAVAGLLGDDERASPPQTVLRTSTITREGTTATVTTNVTTTAPPPTTAPSSPGGTLSASAAAELNDRAYALMQQGRHEEALPMLERAIAALRGTGELAEAYTSYNLAATRLALGRCDEVFELLDRSQELQRPRREIAQARAQARKACR